MDDKPPPLPPKLRNMPSVRYSEEDQAKALEEEKKVFENFERSNSQRVTSVQRENIILTRQRSCTPTEKKSQFNDINYTSFPTARPIPKPRSISLQQTNAISKAEVEKTSNLKNNNVNNLDLMSFVSPEKPKNDILEQLHNINKNQNCILPTNQVMGIVRSSLTSSQSMPFPLTFPSVQNSVSDATTGLTYKFTNNQTKLLNFPSPNYTTAGQNILSEFSQLSTPFNVPPNIPFSPIITDRFDAAPPLPNRSPVVDHIRLSLALNTVSNNSPSTSSNTSCHQTSTSTNVLKIAPEVKAACKPVDLIDLGSIKDEICINSVSSILEDFDPLITKSKKDLIKEEYDIDTSNNYIALSNEAKELLRFKASSRPVPEDEESYYEPVDPFVYMQPSSALSSRSDPVLDIYAGLGSPGALGGETFDIPPPLPPRIEPVTIRPSRKRSNAEKSKKRSATVYEEQCTPHHIELIKMSALSADSEAIAFWEKIKGLRCEYVCTDYIGNPGLLHSPCLQSSNALEHSMKLAVFYQNKDPALFTCNLDTGVEHVMMQALVALEIYGESSDYLLKVRGVDEYLCGETQLGEYEYVHLCIKNDQDILFTLVSISNIKKSYLRTNDDDCAIECTDAKNLLTVGSTDAIYYDSLAIAIEVFEKELNRLQESAFQLIIGTPIDELSFPMRSRQVRQVVKQICALLGKIETFPISTAIVFLINVCKTIQKSQGILDGEDDVPGQIGMLSTGSQDSYQEPKELREMILDALSRISGALNKFLFMYTKTFRVDFTVSTNIYSSDESQEIISQFDRVKIQICSLHRLNNWQFDEFFVEAQLCHGTTCVGRAIHSVSYKVSGDPKFYPKINFNQWLDMGFRVNTIPLESRVVFTVFGVKTIPPENKSDPPKFIREELGWAAVQMFSYDKLLTSGGFLLTLWPMMSDKRLGPAPCSSDHPSAHTCPILSVELMDYGMELCFPPVKYQTPNLLNFDDLDVNTQQQLSDIVERDIFTFNKSNSEDREILWEKRHYLHHEPAALAKVLLAAHSWDVSCLPDIHTLVENWTPPKPADALHLLLPSFPDTVVRNKAVQWIRGLVSDELIAYLPQLVQAIKHEAWDVSKLTELLLERALTSPRLAHHLYWLLNQCLPVQTSMGGSGSEVIMDARYTRRLIMVTKALMTICGSNMESRLLRQEAVLRNLYEIAIAIKDAKDSNRTVMLHHKLQDTHENLKECPTSLPLSPSLEVAGVDIDACSYYTSFTVPLRLAFLSSEPNTAAIHTIFKVGDDLRQDMLVIQMIRLMDKLWLNEGLDLKIITFNVIPTGHKIGILEMVRNAETLRKIQTEDRVAGCFEERSIADWLAKQNPSQLEYHRAVSNFTSSCAGYCVATYILGICDRHNDNIMIKHSGHLFHIDFGRFLGDAQKIGSFKRDRTPFVLTSDMAYVINGGVKASDKFQSFVDLCCKAFNVIRQNAHLLLYLFALMASSGIPGVTCDAVLYVEKALLQDLTNAEAGAFFAKMIQESLKNWFVQVNFFFHNLAQLRFSAETTESDALLSFVPRKFTMSEDGRIRTVSLYSFQKRYNPNKYYVYILQVNREGEREPSYLFRSYKEFSEFHQKICRVFPLAIIHSLPKGVQIGRSEVKAVAEKRKFDIDLFLSSLLSLAEEIAHSDLVYTFFHPLLRDQEDTNIHIRKLKIKDTRSVSSPAATPGNSSASVQGQVKVNVQYIRGQLQIIVQHARNLSQEPGATAPSPYVKLYLLPDRQKRTKRKTKVVKKSCHPTFMEKITYRMTLGVIRQKVLEISVWSEDKFSENSYLGSAYLKMADLDYKKENCEWLSLEHNIETAREHIFQPLPGRGS